MQTTTPQLAAGLMAALMDARERDLLRQKKRAYRALRRRWRRGTHTPSIKTRRPIGANGGQGGRKGDRR